MIGARLSHYLVTARIGAGGMGEVYRAHDEHLGRDVAIKVLRPDFLTEDAARARLRREARSLSQLSHPNICAVFDFDSDGDRSFMVVELLEGETLAETVGRGPLPNELIRRIAREIASALEAAHEKGVVHRDLKPGNVIVTRRGVTKVLDFGLARVTRDPSPTVSTQSAVSSEHSAGTLPYMAPEQVRGEASDVRTDIYGLGATLYELATGRRPFAEAQSLALAAAILYHPPEPPRSLGAKIDPALEGVILRCLEKDPSRRFQSAAEVEKALVDASRPSIPAKRAPLWRRLKPVALLTVLVAAMAAAGWLARSGCGNDGAFSGSGRVKGIAVLPLENLSGDASQEFFADGMTDELITTLGQVSALRVISRGSVMRYKKTSKSSQDIARALGVDLLIEGALMRSGNQVRVSARVVEAAKDRLLWSGTFDRAITDVLGLQSDVARAVLQVVKVRATPDEQSRLSRPRVSDPAAYEAYLRGRELHEEYTQESLLKAIASYERAATLQPTFAPAYAGIASCYLQLSTVYLDADEAMPRAESASMKALAIDSTSSEALASLAYVRGFYRYDWAAAEAGLRRAVQLHPSDAFAHSTLGYLLAVLGRFDEALPEFRTTRALDPLSQVYATYSLMPLYEGRRFDDAIREATEILRADPSATFARLIRGEAYAMKGAYTAAIDDLRLALAAERHPTMLAFLTYAQSKVGDRAGADSTYEELRAVEKGMHEQPYAVAIALLARGDREAALASLERGLATHHEEVVWLRDDPVMDPLRAEPRFQAILRQIGLAGST